MKRILLAMLAIAGLVFATSCSGDDDNDVTLSLSQDSIEFTKDGGDNTIAVSTDAESWSAIGSADWIDVKVNGTNLEVKVAKNETVYDRKGKILVVAGNANATIEVMQKSENGTASVLPEKINLEDTKGKAVVEVNANDKKWTVESNAEWLKVEAKQYKAELVLMYDENPKEEDRTAVVTITVGGDKTMVDVTQLGKMVFLIPYPKMVEAGREDIMAYEELRKNKLDEGYSNETRIAYITRSREVFPTMTYNLTEDGKHVKECVVNAKTAEIMEAKLDDFKAFLMGEGFKAETDLMFANEELSMTAEIKFVNGWFGKFALVSYKPIPKQDKEYPTFSKFPYGFIEWGAMKDKIDAYEAKEGGVYNEANSTIGDPNGGNDFLWFDIPKDKGGEAEANIRAYFVGQAKGAKPGLVETAQVFKKTTVAFYMFNGEPVLTNEFKELCKKEGFEYKGFNNFHRFENAAKKIGMALRQVTFSGDETPSLQLNLFELAEENGASNDFYQKEEKNKVVKLSDSAR